MSAAFMAFPSNYPFYVLFVLDMYAGGIRRLDNVFFLMENWVMDVNKSDYENGSWMLVDNCIMTGMNEFECGLIESK